MKLRLNKRKKKHVIATILSLLLCLLVLSAFSFKPEHKPLLTRFDLALMLESVLSDDMIPDAEIIIPDFSDLSSAQKDAIKLVLSLNLMSGFPDITFRPGHVLSNFETVFYLQKLTDYLRQVRPESYACRQLLRIFALNTQPGTPLINPQAKLFPKELSSPASFLEKAVFAKILAAIIDNDDQRSFVLQGKVIDAVSGKPLANAYVAGARKAVVTDEKGEFALSFRNLQQNSVLLLATAEEYQSLELKKNLSLSDKVTFRLRPAKQKPGQISR